MQEMVGTARRMGNHGVATRHMTYLLEVMFEHLSEGEKADFTLTPIIPHQTGSLKFKEKHM